jgi:hypothetical protein
VFGEFSNRQSGIVLQRQQKDAINAVEGHSRQKFSSWWGYSPES